MLSENYGFGNGGFIVDFVVVDILIDEIGEVVVGDFFGVLVVYGGDFFWGEVYGGLVGVDVVYGGDGVVVVNDLFEVEVIV